VKYSKGIFINNIVQNFKVIGITVKADKQMSTANVSASVTFIQLFVVQNIIKSPAYISPAYAMLERRFAELDDNIHVSSIPRLPFLLNEPDKTAPKSGWRWV
jgi:hypothetical protein